MERQRCPHCGHPSPPSSPGVSIEDSEKRSSPVQSCDFIDPSLTAPTPIVEPEQVEPNLASDLYRPFWDFLGLTLLSVCSLIRTNFCPAFRLELGPVCAPIAFLTLLLPLFGYISAFHIVYFFLTPASFPWFLVVIGFFVAAWTVYYILRQLGDDKLTAEQRSASLFDAHLRFQIAVCLFSLLVWVFIKPWPRPWFIFVFSGSGAIMTLHYTISFVDCKRMWLFPQLQLYLNVVFTCFIGNTFYAPPFQGAWWLWPTALWGILILLQLLIFTLIARRRIRMSELDTEEGRRETSSYPLPSTARSSRKGRAKVGGAARDSQVEKPLLADFMHAIDELPSHTSSSSTSPAANFHHKRSPHHNQHHHHQRSNSPLRPTARANPQPIQSPVARVKQHQLVAPVYVDPNLIDGKLASLDASETDDAALLVEYVSTPPTSARFPPKTQQSAKPLAMRVVHHDEQTTEAIEGSLTGSEGIYIDVVHIPRNRGFG